MVGLKMKYFVLKPEGSSFYAEASRAAMMAYAIEIAPHNVDLAKSLRDWVAEERDKNPLPDLETMREVQ